MTLFSGLRSEYNLLIEAFEALSAMLAIQLDYLRTHKHKYTFAEIKNLLAVVTALQHEVEIITSDPKFIACSERANLAWQNHKTDFTKCEPSHWKASDDVVSADHVLRTA